MSSARQLEALAGQPQDARSDQFSFAAALWKALSGALPYDPKSDDPEQRRPLHAPKVPLPASVLEALFRRALDPVPARRFPDMPALLSIISSSSLAGASTSVACGASQNPIAVSTPPTDYAPTAGNASPAARPATTDAECPDVDAVTGPGASSPLAPPPRGQ
ncbi:hypothetical protein OV203_17945 [Nannocystis sp. ILAH1]|uniref:hypothetical protein n=1 Tax=unclassified Nannocystis TaxID=2627009 RepID=UPI00226F014D|nr:MULTISPECIES: hypothetical protein [unclassified Nannocystis]MCY0989024.1 hypothetical protein [Nannocystis sp. ILAH1]MCY1068039.1 hypothetical protein [Nannocystis sp. RBIL2]